MITLLKASHRSLMVILPGVALLFAGCAKDEETVTGSTTGTPAVELPESTDEGAPETEAIADATGSTGTAAKESTEGPEFELPDTPIPTAGVEEHSAWLTDYELARKQATEENKTILMDFTGSDWCGWCIRLHEEVFSLPEFQEYAEKNLVLLELDFPRGKQLPPALVAQNEKLQDEFDVQGFPTILLLDGDGRPFGRTGYQEGGPTAYINHLSEFIDIRQVRDKAFADADKAQGIEKARYLGEALAVLSDDVVLPAYRPVVDEIIALDPNDEAGLKSKFTGLIARVEVTEKLASLQMLLRRSDDEEQIFGEFQTLEKEYAETPEALSQILLLKIQVLSAFGKSEELLSLAGQLAKAESLGESERSMVVSIHAATLEKNGRPEKGIELLDAAITEFEQIEAVLQLHLVKVQLLAGIGELDAARATIAAAQEEAPEELKERVAAIGKQILDAAPRPTEPETKPEGEPPVAKEPEAKDDAGEAESSPDSEKPEVKPAAEKPAAEKPAAEKPAAENGEEKPAPAEKE